MPDATQTATPPVTEPTVASIEAEVKELEAQIAAKEAAAPAEPSEPTIAISQSAFALAVQQIQAGVTILARHSASNVAGSLFADSLTQLQAGLTGLKALQS
jgi:hypothetical protein